MLEWMLEWMREWVRSGPGGGGFGVRVVVAVFTTQRGPLGPTRVPAHINIDI